MLQSRIHDGYILCHWRGSYTRSGSHGSNNELGYRTFDGDQASHCEGDELADYGEFLSERDEGLDKSVDPFGTGSGGCDREDEDSILCFRRDGQRNQAAVTASRTRKDPSDKRRKNVGYFDSEMSEIEKESVYLRVTKNSIFQYSHFWGH